MNTLLKYHKKNGGLSRYDKFDYFFSEILHTVEDKKSYSEYLERFSKFVNQGIKSCSMVKGVKDFLEYLRINNKTSYIVSGADQEELIKIFKNRNIHFYFKNIYGSPGDKASYIDKIKKKEKKGEGLFFGDSFTDFEASQVSKLDFIYVRKHSEWLPRKEQVKKMKFSINDFEELINFNLKLNLLN